MSLQWREQTIALYHYRNSNDLMDLGKHLEDPPSGVDHTLRITAVE